MSYELSPFCIVLTFSEASATRFSIRTRWMLTFPNIFRSWAYTSKNQGAGFTVMRHVPQKYHMDGIVLDSVVNAMRMLAVQSLLTRLRPG